MIPALPPAIANLRASLIPKSAFAWPTVIYMSLISWIMSAISRLLGASAFTVGLMATLAWIFLALGVGWAFEARNIKPFGLSLGPWVAGGILCLFLFGSWGGAWLQPALISWPLMSFVVVAVPNLLTWEFRPKRPSPSVRQSLALMLGLSLLLSSWFQFYFRLQTWLRDYPSLIADRFDQSAFVYRIPGQTMPLSAGISHLTQAEFWVQEQIDGKPWSWVERWLLNLEGHQQSLQRQMQLAQPNSPEHRLWNLHITTTTNGNGYTLRMMAIWLGPSADSDSYYFEKTCDVMPIDQPPPYVITESIGSSTPGSSTQWAEVRCQLETPLRHGRP